MSRASIEALLTALIERVEHIEDQLDELTDLARIQGLAAEAFLDDNDGEW